MADMTDMTGWDEHNLEKPEKPDLNFYMLYVKVYKKDTKKVINGLCKLYSDVMGLNFDDLHKNNGKNLKYILDSFNSNNTVKNTQIIDVFGIVDYNGVKENIDKGLDMNEVIGKGIMYDYDYDNGNSEYINVRYL